MQVVQIVASSNHESLGTNKGLIIGLNKNFGLVVSLRYAHPGEELAVSAVLEHVFFLALHLR